MTNLQARLEAAIRLLYPDRMTPTARNVLLRILEDEAPTPQPAKSSTAGANRK